MCDLFCSLELTSLHIIMSTQLPQNKIVICEKKKKQSELRERMSSNETEATDQRRAAAASIAAWNSSVLRGNVQMRPCAVCRRVSTCLHQQHQSYTYNTTITLVWLQPGFHSNSIACVACVVWTKTARNASACVWMETGLDRLKLQLHGVYL